MPITSLKAPRKSKSSRSLKTLGSLRRDSNSIQGSPAFIRAQRVESGKWVIDNFKDAYILRPVHVIQKALERTGPVEEDVDVIIEGISSLEIISDRISIPDLVGDPELPSASLLDAVYRVTGPCNVLGNAGVFRPLGQSPSGATTYC